MHFNLTAGVTPVSHDIYLLHMTVLLVCVCIGLIVFGTIIFSIVHHRKSKAAKPATFHQYLWLELTWTIIPFIILVILAIPATKVLSHINNNSHEAADVTIVITGYQWKWKYEYLNQGINFFSNLSTSFDQLNGKAPKNLYYLREVDHPLILPIHKKIHFLITANDVIHSWWVPELGIKRDAVPGFITESWTQINRPGVYRGQCAELCGINHAFMPIVVIAVTENEFNTWLQSQVAGTTQSTPEKPVTPTKIPEKIIPPAEKTPVAVSQKISLEQLLAKGKTIYLNTCAACHKPDGSGMPPVFPALTNSPIVSGPVAKHIHTVVFGVPGTAMQAFGQQLTPEDLAAVITYERDEIAKHKNEIVQTDDVIAIQKGSKP